MSYEDLRKRHQEVLRVTRSHYMPPWLPEPGFNHFVGERGLTNEEIDTIRNWVRDGLAEGNPADLPELPRFVRGWQMGQPDLVVEMPEAYMLSATGTDVFRNFVIPVPIEADHYVRFIELRPANPKVVHHAVVRVDRSFSSRLRDQQDEEMGWGGMNMANAEAPDGHILGWTPGRMPDPGAEDVAWSLRRGDDLVLQLHMLPSGKREVVQPKIGLHFAKGPPPRRIFALVLRSESIDIPAGERQYVVEDRVVLPVNVRVLSAYPHAHYLGKKLHGFAVLPDGTQQWLLRIDNWDFDWQDKYRYIEPIELPRGTTIHMHYTYDNSADNVRNPNSPPRRVVYGSDSSNEMAVLSFEVLTESDDHTVLLKEAVARQNIEQNPRDWLAYQNLGTTLEQQGKANEALQTYVRALEINDSLPVVLNNLGMLLHNRGQHEEAGRYLKRALSVNPSYAVAHQNLGVVLAAQGRLEEATVRFRRAIELKPYNADSHYNLGIALLRMGRHKEAIGAFRTASVLDPKEAAVRNNLGYALTQAGEFEEAAVQYRQALDLAPDSAEAHANLGNILIMQGHFDEAVAHFREALRLQPQSADLKYNLREALEMQAELQAAIEKAERLAESTNYRSPTVLEELAAIYAAAGRFDKAVEAAERALESASKEQAVRIRGQLDRYRQGKF